LDIPQLTPSGIILVFSRDITKQSYVVYKHVLTNLTHAYLVYKHVRANPTQAWNQAACERHTQSAVRCSTEWSTGRDGQNHIYTLHVTAYLVIYLPNIPCIHRIFMVLANPEYRVRSLKVSTRVGSLRVSPRVRSLKVAQG